MTDAERLLVALRSTLKSTEFIAKAYPEVSIPPEGLDAMEKYAETMRALETLWRNNPDLMEPKRSN